jgi:formylglycine-generating enzyme required for sulfatase activity
MIRQINRTRIRVSITIIAALLSLTVACNKHNAEDDAAARKRALLTPKEFGFKTVTLDAKGKTTSVQTLVGKSYIEDLGSGVQLEMVEVPPGTFIMGSSPSDVQSAITDARYFRPLNFDDETPQHQVSVAQLNVGKYEVTQGQWRAVANLPKVKIDLPPEPSTGGSDRADNKPVEKISWDDAVEFCARLSKATGREYRLPSEAEWEYACRAGTQTPFAFGETITGEIAIFSGGPYARAYEGGNSGFTTAVGSLGVANGFGLFDMHGNVWEWCSDYWHENYKGAPTDGSAWLSGGDSKLRVARGGSAGDEAYLLRSAKRARGAPDGRGRKIGFRVVGTGRTQ